MTNFKQPNLNELEAIVEAVMQEKYPEADVVFLAGSVVRGEATKTSDLDLVVMYKKLPNAFRESFTFGGWPVEAFVHDPETLAYFMARFDAPSGVPSLAAMVTDGIALPVATPLSLQVKQCAVGVLNAGPPPWTLTDIDNSRYIISDLADDLKDPRNVNELYAIGSQLYTAIACHYCRSRGEWAAKGKTIPRRLQTLDPVFAEKFNTAFQALFARGCSMAVLVLAAEVLVSQGGFLFDGYHLAAPATWRQPPP